ncbi:hypothetical protein CMI47_03490 [Candidatus Pacearchaeota archaeon]|nr:hypothetical protein [Candidatus Pacearchaeota archaeon]|tara:strand:- start:487 stop:723 length:237 start_codon:yes stop_codon:yes gene_type:complete
MRRDCEIGAGVNTGARSRSSGRHIQQGDSLSISSVSRSIGSYVDKRNGDGYDPMAAIARRYMREYGRLDEFMEDAGGD